MNKGYTIIEVLVSILIFSLIIGAGMGAFVSAVKLQKYNLTHQQILEQTSYALEYMARTIRMAQKDDGTCLSSGDLNYEEKQIPTPGTAIINGLMFRDFEGTCRGFFMENGELKEYEQGRNPDILPLTSDKLEVLSFNFNLIGQSDGDNLQPKVTLFMEIQGKGLGDQPRLKIQTTISQRNLDM